MVKNRLTKIGQIKKAKTGLATVGPSPGPLADSGAIKIFLHSINSSLALAGMTNGSSVLPWLETSDVTAGVLGWTPLPASTMLKTMDGSTPAGRRLLVALVISPQMRAASTRFPAMSAVFMSSCWSANHSKTSAPWWECCPPSSNFEMERRSVVQLGPAIVVQIQHNLLESAHFCTGIDRLWLQLAGQGPWPGAPPIVSDSPLCFGCTLDVKLFDPLPGPFEESLSSSDLYFQRHLLSILLYFLQ